VFLDSGDTVIYRGGQESRNENAEGPIENPKGTGLLERPGHVLPEGELAVPSAHFTGARAEEARSEAV
jgi:hypothetical protein